MPQQYESLYCEECQRNTKHIRERTEYQQFSLTFFNVFMTLISCGLWIPIWILMAVFGRPGWVCDRCGTKN